MTKRVLIGLTILIILNLSACGSFTIQGEALPAAEAIPQKLEGETMVGDATASLMGTIQTKDAGDLTSTPIFTGEPTSMPNTQVPTSTPSPLPISTATLVSDKPTPTEPKDYVLNIQFRSISPVPFGNSSIVKIGLWAYGHGIADAPATNLLTSTSTISSLDQVFIIAFDKEDFERVTPQPKGVNENDFGYYVAFYIDMNNDGQICPGEDYGQDSEKTAPVFFDESDLGVRNMEVFIRPETIDCHPF